MTTGSTAGNQQTAAGVVGQQFVASVSEPTATGGVPSVVPDIQSEDAISETQNLDVVNEGATPFGVTGE